MSQIKVTLVRGLAGKKGTQILTVKALGLSKVRQSVIHTDSPGLQGQLAKVKHLVIWEQA